MALYAALLIAIVMGFTVSAALTERANPAAPGLKVEIMVQAAK